jgi:hypothetical protein
VKRIWEIPDNPGSRTSSGRNGEFMGRSKEQGAAKGEHDRVKPQSTHIGDKYYEN